MNEKKQHAYGYDGTPGVGEDAYVEEGILPFSHPRHQSAAENEVFGNEEGHSIKYRTMSWQMVSVLMIAEIVSNGMLSLPSSGTVVGVSKTVHGNDISLSKCVDNTNARRAAISKYHKVPMK